MKYDIVKAQPDAVVIDAEFEPAEGERPPPTQALARVNPNDLVDGQARPWDGQGGGIFSKLRPGLIYKIKFTLHGWKLNYPVETYEVEARVNWKEYDRPTLEALEVRGGFVHRDDDYRPVHRVARSPVTSIQGSRVRSFGDLRSMLAREYEDLTYKVNEVSWH